jgi:hypothetical protein
MMMPFSQNVGFGDIFGLGQSGDWVNNRSGLEENLLERIMRLSE